MPLPSKQKRKLKEQTRTIDGKFDKKANKDSQQLIDDNNNDVSVEEFFNEDEDWGDDDDSEWDDLEDMEAELRIYQRIRNCGLVWKDDNHLEKIKRGPYKIGKTPKSTYYDKYGPSGSLTKAAAGTKKITDFFKNSDTQATDLQLSNQDTLNDILSDTDSSNLESEIVCPRNYQITEKIKDLKEQLEKQYNQLTVIEYNYKRAIFEYLTLLNNNNGRKKVDISLEVVQKIYIDGGVWKARKIRNFTKYWLLNNKLPESRHGKHQKTIRVIDDEDVAERCHIWIRKQNFNTTPATFKKFVENELFPAIGIAKEKSITIMTATRCKYSKT
ncbi:unnamed protein product [Rhizophagus irregularis]|nr:unnamed protein product [Rhizophagus irregularis]